MQDSKPITTPLSTSTLLLTSGKPLSDSTSYRSLVGALHYSTISHPDLPYVVDQVNQFLHALMTDHFQAVKRILHYVKGTLSYGVHFTRPPSSSLIGYSDANSARCIEIHRSAYVYSILIGGNLVSFSAKKQLIVHRSSCESEYRTMENTVVEIVWITHLLCELHALPPDRSTLLRYN